MTNNAIAEWIHGQTFHWRCKHVILFGVVCATTSTILSTAHLALCFRNIDQQQNSIYNDSLSTKSMVKGQDDSFQDIHAFHNLIVDGGSNGRPWITQQTFLEKKQQQQQLPRLVICGTAHNVQPHLRILKNTIQKQINNTFQLVHMIFIDGNSTDNTLLELQGWNDIWNVTVLLEDPSLSLNSKTSLEQELSTERTVRLAEARNQLWHHVARLYDDKSSACSIDYVLMMDMDDVNWHLSNLDQCFLLPSDWAVCCCNSYKVYYDLWALRTLHRNNDWDSNPADPRHGNSIKTNEDKVWNCHAKQHKFGPIRGKPFCHIPAQHDPIPVQSCFGGAALYKYGGRPILQEIATANPYHGVLTQQDHDEKVRTTTAINFNTTTRRTTIPTTWKPVCEHVSFHLTLYSKNQSLYIQPSFLNDGPSDERMLFFGAVKKRWESEYQKSWNETPHYYQNFFHPWS